MPSHPSTWLPARALKTYEVRLNTHLYVFNNAKLIVHYCQQFYDTDGQIINCKIETLFQSIGT